MEAENLITYFDCYWYELEILKKQPHPSNSEASPVQEPPNQILPKITTSFVNETTSISSSDSKNYLSPSSVLNPNKFSSKQVKAQNRVRENRRKKLERRQSKSLSDLEFVELKGFTELGFVFSEEDTGSDILTSILPGLQSFGEEEEDVRRNSSSRPYLSEVWEGSEMVRRKSYPLKMSWHDLPSLGNKIDMKDYIKSWAHNVAFSVTLRFCFFGVKEERSLLTC